MSALEPFLAERRATGERGRKGRQYAYTLRMKGKEDERRLTMKM
jgi:hypothetical protein